MALSGTIKKYVAGTNSQIWLEIKWSATQNISANTSTITATAYVGRGSYGAFSSSAHKHGLQIGSQEADGTGNPGGSSNSTTNMGSATYTFSHNSDGTLKIGLGFYCGFEITFSGTYIGTATTGTNYITLDPIPRGFTWNGGILDFNIGESTQGNWNVTSSSYTATVDLYLGSTKLQSWSGLTGGVSEFDMNTDTTQALINGLGSSTNELTTWKLSTYNGSTQIGSTVSTQAYAVLDNTDIPTLSNVVTKEGNSAVATVLGSDSTGVYIQNKSQLIVTFTATAQNGGTIASQGWSLLGSSYDQGATGDVISSSGTLTVDIYAIDNRGLRVDQTETINVLPYDYPNFNSISIYRVDTGTTTADSKGTSLLATYDVSAISTKSGTDEKNAIKTIDFKYSTDNSTWTDDSSVSPNVLETNSQTALKATYDAIANYYIQVTITDNYGSQSVWMGQIGTQPILMSWNKTTVGIGKVGTQGVLDVGGDAYFSSAVDGNDFNGVQYYVNDSGSQAWLNKDGLHLTLAGMEIWLNSSGIQVNGNEVGYVNSTTTINYLNGWSSEGRTPVIARFGPLVLVSLYLVKSGSASTNILQLPSWAYPLNKTYSGGYASIGGSGNDGANWAYTTDGYMTQARVGLSDGSVISVNDVFLGAALS